jgi:PAS domain S-box-containing protein
MLIVWPTAMATPRPRRLVARHPAGKPIRVPDRSRAEELLAALADLTVDLSSDLSPTEAGRQLLRLGMATIGAAGGSARVVDARGESFRIVEVGPASGVPSPAATLDCRESAWFSTARSISSRFPGAATHGWGALALIPVELGGTRVGDLALWFEEERKFCPSERSFVRALGRTLAQEVDRASLKEERRKADNDRRKMARWAGALGETYRMIASPAWSLKRILDELARVSCELPADMSAIRVLSADGRSLEYRGLHHRDPAQAKILRSVLEERAMPANLGETARVLEDGAGLRLPTVDMDKLLRTYAGTPFGDYVARFPVTTVMVVPLRSRGSIFGVVTVARTEPQPFQEADLRFLQEVADRAAVAIDNANLLQKLAHSEEQLRVALEAGRLGAWDWDIPRQQVAWSAMLERIHGLEEGTFGGDFEAYQRDIHPEDRERVLSTITQIVEQRADYYVSYRIIRPDGEVRWLEAYGKLLCDPAGALQRLVGVCADITDRKKAEEQLSETLLALRDADQRKDQFLAMLAHELRNPLGPVLNATYLLANPGLPEASAARARKILDRQIRHMARLLDDLLDVSRISRGKVELVRETVDVSALAREVVDDHLESFRSAGLTLDLSVAAEPLFIHADRTRMAQVVGNLLSNALKFSESGQSVRVRVDRDEPGGTVVLTVRDQGMGIEPALLGRMFKPFEQADTSLARHRGGLGLGLALVNGLVTLNGGRVSASSGGLGQGAEFRVELPLHTAEREAPASSERAPGLARGSSAKVLVFEDNADAAECLRGILSGAGYRVCVEATGWQAIDAVRRFGPDMVLCDLGLPGRDGYAIAADIRSDPELSHLPLIAISGYGTIDDQARSRRAGFDLHLTKPVPPSILLSELSRHTRASVVPTRL